SYHVYKNLEPSMSTENLELSMSTKNLEPLQNPLSTYDVLFFPDRDFLNDSGSNETSTEKLDDHKQITCKLCNSKYEIEVVLVQLNSISKHLTKMLEFHYRNTAFRRLWCIAHKLNLAV
ncbi:13413_t:CDS:2, partial [Racocetra persica]